MASKARFDASRWLGTSLLLFPLLMGAALVGGALSNRQRTYEASTLLIRAQADSFVRVFAGNLRHSEAAPSQALVDEVYEDLSSEGLTYLAIVHSSGTILGAAGRAKGRPSPSEMVPGTPLRLSELDGRVRASTYLPGRRPPFAKRGAGTRFEARRGQRLLIMEFEPGLAQRLRQDVDRSFVLSSLTALVLMLVASALYWQLRRRQTMAESREREHRLAQLGEMSAVLAHEMRNPLASLKGHAQLLLERLPGGSRESKKTARIVAEAERLEALSTTLLDFVRSGTISREPVDVRALAQQAADELGRDRITITSIGMLERKASLDPLRMRQVLINLLQNALEASSEGPPVEVELELKARTLAIRVRDHGPGLPAALQSNMFDAFYTEKTQGTGLGLAIARRIVELHEGSLTARNHPEGGALLELEIVA